MQGKYEHGIPLTVNFQPLFTKPHTHHIHPSGHEGAEASYEVVETSLVMNEIKLQKYEGMMPSYEAVDTRTKHRSAILRPIPFSLDAVIVLMPLWWGWAVCWLLPVDFLRNSCKCKTIY